MSKWKSGQYSTYKRCLDGGLVLSVWWDDFAPKGEEKMWKAEVDGHRLKGRYMTRLDAQAAVERVATRSLSKALADLAETTPDHA